MNPGKRTEVREGKTFKVTVLPAAEPPKGRSKKTRYKLKDVGKEGSAAREKR